MPAPSTDKTSGATATLFAALLCALALAVACGGEDRLGGTSNDSDEDAGVSADANGQEDAGGEDEDTGIDAGGDEDDRPLPEGRSAFQQCAAAGTASGGGYSVVQCTAPVERRGQVAEGGGYRLEQRAFQWVAP